jgi:hypothetical protein
MDTIHTETLGDYTVEIHHDEDYDSDYLLGNDDIFIVADHRQFNVGNKDAGFNTIEDVQTMVEDDDDDDTEYAVFDLFAYIHSGIMLKLREFSCQWDSGQIGYVLVKRSVGWVPKEGEETNAPAMRRAAESVVSEWNEILFGNVYGFRVLKGDEEVDSCWGFVGDYDGDDGCLEEARDIAKWHQEKDDKAREPIDVLIAEAQAWVKSGEENPFQKAVIGEKRREANRISELADQVEYLLSSGWTVDHIREEVGCIEVAP